MRSKSVFGVGLLATVFLLSGCQLLRGSGVVGESTLVQLPFFKNSANECYYLDEFMPVPDALVTGKNGSLAIRYYTYHFATYKDWAEMQVVLSFYSRDDRCWSLFEEYLAPK